LEKVNRKETCEEYRTNSALGSTIRLGRSYSEERDKKSAHAPGGLEQRNNCPDKHGSGIQHLSFGVQPDHAAVVEGMKKAGIGILHDN
jgi:hypothetical protein